MGKRKAKKGKSAKNAKKNFANEESPELLRAPHSFVIHKGKLGKNANELMINFRKIMEPYTAAKLKVSKHNVVKDFVHMAGPLNVTHLVVFSKTQIGMYLRIAKLPRGPTLTFQIQEYSLARDIISSQKRALVYEKLFRNHPLLVLNNFSGEGMQLKLMTTMFQNIFPSINVNKTNLNTIRRCVLINYNSEDKTMDLRHFAIKVVPTGMSKAVKKLVQSRVPNLSQFQYMSEFLQKSGNLSDSEVEIDNALNTVVLPQPISSRGNITSQKSAIRLYELGPRIKMKLLKIQEGVVSGDVLFHDYIFKTPEEIKALKARIEAKKRLKEKRRLIQKQNVERKKKEKKNEKEKEVEEKVDSEEEDIEWYQKEVGKEPDEDFSAGIKKRRAKGSFIRPAKKAKLSGDVNKKDSKSPKTFQDVLAMRKKKKQAKEKKNLIKKNMNKKNMNKKNMHKSKNKKKVHFK